MKKIISCIILLVCVLNMFLPVSVVYAKEDTEYECIQLPVISDDSKKPVTDIALFKDNKDDILYASIADVCLLINAEWHMKDGGFYIVRDSCMYFRYYSDGNMKLIFDLGVGDDIWNKPDNILLEGNLFSCKKIDVAWYVDFIKFCDMFGVNFLQVSQSTIQSAKDNISKNIKDSTSEKLNTIAIENDLDFKNNPYYIYLYSGTPLISFYAQIMGDKNLYLWDYSCYENLVTEDGNWFENLLENIKYSNITTGLTIQSQNWLSNVINDNWGITKIIQSPIYKSSEHYKKALVNISNVNYDEYLKLEDVENLNTKNKAQELERLLNSNTIISSSDSTITILNRYLNDKIKIPELETFAEISDIINCIGTPIQTWFEVENFHNKLNSIHEDKIQLLTKSIIENNFINDMAKTQKIANNTLNFTIKTPSTNIFLNSIDNYTGLRDSSKEICSLYKNSDKQFKDKLGKSIESGGYALGDAAIAKVLEESGDPYLILAGAVIGVYDGFTAWTKENFGEQLQNSENLVQSYFLEKTMKSDLDLKNPDNLYNRLRLMLQSSLCCFEYDKNYFQSNRNSISKMLYKLDNDNSININYYHDPRNNNVDKKIQRAILDYSNNIIEPNSNYEWYLAPTIEAEDIIVSDDSIYTITPHNKDIEKASDKYSIIKTNGKYSFIEYNGNIPIENKYDEYNFLDAGEILLTMNDSYQSHLATDGYDNNQVKLEDCKDGWGRGATGGYTNFFYDSQDNTIWAEGMEILKFDDYISIYGNSVKKPVVFQQVIINNKTIADGYLKLDNINKTGKYGVYYDGNIIIEPIYNDGFMSLYNDIVVLNKDNQWYYFNGKTGKKLFDIPIKLNSSNVHVENAYSDDEIKTLYPYAFSDGYVALYTENGCGYYDIQGNEVIPCGTFEEVRPVHNGLAWVKQDGKWGVIKLEKVETEPDTSEDNSKPTVSEVTAIDLINKSIPEIIEMMGGTYEIIEGAIPDVIYIQNQSSISGMVFKINIDCSRNYYGNDGELNENQLRADIENGLYPFESIRIVGSAYATPELHFDMNYEECCSVLGSKLKCNVATLETGAPDSMCYAFTKGDARIELHFDPEEQLATGVFEDCVLENNPNIICIVLRKNTTVLRDHLTNSSMNPSQSAKSDVIYTGNIIDNDFTGYYTATINEENTMFTIESTLNSGVIGGFNLPIDKFENGVYSYTNGSCYDRNQTTGAKMHVADGLTGTITVNNDGSLLWKTEDSLPYELLLTPEKVTMTQNWKQLYTDELKKYLNTSEYNSDAMFDLYDINNDNIPELFISTGISHANDCRVYTISDNKIQELCHGGEYGTINCSSSIQTIFSLWSKSGHNHIDYYQIQDNNIVHVNAYNNITSGEDVIYKINDEIVTSEKYNQELSKYEVNDYVNVGRKYKLDEVTINSVL